MLPEHILEFRSYPVVSEFVTNHLSMQFGDVRSMMRLPLPDLRITHACNFAATAVLCNLISGISVSLYKPSQATRTNKKGKLVWIGSGEAFKSLLTEFYPFAQEETRKEGANALYDVFRNPFAHALGVHGRTTYAITIARLPSGPGLEETELVELESSVPRPEWLPPGLSGSGRTWTLVVEGFYRDVLHMLWNLSKNVGQMTATEQRFAKDQFIWSRGVPPQD
jgi:hypothetical protein